MRAYRGRARQGRVAKDLGGNHLGRHRGEGQPDVTVPEGEQDKINDVRRRGPDPLVETIVPQEVVQVRKESPWWTQHIYVNEDGKFGWNANSWEAPVLKVALEDKNVIGWMRNLPRRPGSLCIPFGKGEKKPLYPDMLVFRKERGKIRVDILDPHGSFLGDAPEKAVGLAAFARTHGEAFGRIELIRVVDGRIMRLPLHHHQVCEKVEKVTDKDHLNDLFEQFGTA